MSAYSQMVSTGNLSKSIQSTGRMVEVSSKIAYKKRGRLPLMEKGFSADITSRTFIDRAKQRRLMEEWFYG